MVFATRWTRPGIGEKSAQTYHADDHLVPLERELTIQAVIGEMEMGVIARRHAWALGFDRHSAIPAISRHGGG